MTLWVRCDRFVMVAQRPLHPQKRLDHRVALGDAPGRERTRAHGWPNSRLVERALNPPALPFKMHIAQAKGGWMCPAANLVRRT
jgi:hypothetical protein